MITPLPLPFDRSDKIFADPCDCEDECICQKEMYSLDDFENAILAISGVSEELKGKDKA